MMIRLSFTKSVFITLVGILIMPSCTRLFNSTRLSDGDSFQKQERLEQVCEGQGSPGSKGSLHNWRYHEPIQIRTGAGLNYSVQHIGHEGDRVEVLSLTVGQDSFCWLKVRLIESDVAGWVRDDYLRVFPSISPQEMLERYCNQIKVGDQGFLSAWTYGEPIQIRTGTGVEHPVRTTGHTGDSVEILNLAMDSTNLSCWTQIRLVGSDKVGWVRNDFIIFPPAAH